ncbi:hybrid sensor histidine kinase/response regulator [Pelobacter seleniigenes]|uniref:hybrid sensor histidine kinase/response regulator n=1 Tax=Pelobacter seleniigenes TaxID=407188 RepID=UPI00068B3527|nr:PAS domain-containing sensor histidine kinase [Pelobacter seleniigenes]
MAQSKDRNSAQQWGDSLLKRRSFAITPGRFALIYAACGVAWIVLSDLLVLFVVIDQVDAFIVETIKGLAYVTLTAALVYWLAGRAQQQIIKVQTAEELKNTQHLLGVILSSLGEAVLLINPDNRTIVECNPAAEKLFGYRRNELLGLNTRILHENVQSYEEFSRVGEPELTRQGVYQAEIRMKRKDSTLIDTQVTVTTINEKTGWQGGVISIIHDMTEQKSTEQRLKESRNQYLDIVEGTPDLITRVDSDGRVLFVNHAANKFFGLNPQECIGRFAFDFLHPDDRARTMAAFSRWLESKQKTFSFENRLKSLTGQVYFMEWSIRAEYDDNGQVCGFASTARDVTEKRCAEAEHGKLQDQLLQAQKMESVGQLAGGIAHDFNNMLSVIIGHAEIALRRSDQDSRIYNNLKEIRTAAKRSADLTRQLLTYARKQTIQPKLLDVNALVSGMLNILRRLIGENIEVIWNPAAELWPVKIDPTQFDQILTNLCLNARDAISGTGQIMIQTKNVILGQKDQDSHPEIVIGDYVRLSVQDNGCGMDPETLAHIFEPFFTTKDPGIGTGLGLATVLGAVKQHKGYVYASSEPGQWTIFNVYLPRAEGVVQIETSPLDRPVREGSETVLLVEDDPMLLNLLKSILEENGYTVLAATNPAAALSLAREYQGSILLLLSDLIMPVMNGRQLFEKLHPLRPEMKVLFMSGYSDDIISSQGVIHEHIHVLQKPIETDLLISTVRNILDAPASN